MHLGNTASIPVPRMLKESQSSKRAEVLENRKLYKFKTSALARNKFNYLGRNRQNQTMMKKTHKTYAERIIHRDSQVEKLAPNSWWSMYVTNNTH